MNNTDIEIEKLLKTKKEFHAKRENQLHEKERLTRKIDVLSKEIDLLNAKIDLLKIEEVSS